MSPSSVPGGFFPILYAVLILAAFLAGLLIPRHLRPAGQRRRVEDVEQLAFLAGGAARFRDAVVTSLLARKLLFLGGSRGRPTFGLARPDRAVSPARRSVLGLHPPVRWHDISMALQDHVALLRQRMTAAGLLVTPGQRALLRFWALLPLLLLLTLGATFGLGSGAGGRPFIFALLAVTLVFALIRALTIDERTSGGIEALRDALRGNDRLRRAPTGEEAALAVALFGTAVLAGTPWADLHRYRNDGGNGCSTAADSCGSGCSNQAGCGIDIGNSGGCGGGGGGCGGCGGS
jgi:uncharacterized protein (TIGR04222 family)